jgi:hypothetical protein
VPGCAAGSVAKHGTAGKSWRGSAESRPGSPPSTGTVTGRSGGDDVDVWEFDRASDLGRATSTVLDDLVPPAFQVALLSSQGDAITVQLVGAKGPSGKPDAVYYVEGRGAYVLERVGEWPLLPGRARKRFLLTLRAYPA